MLVHLQRLKEQMASTRARARAALTQLTLDVSGPCCFGDAESSVFGEEVNVLWCISACMYDASENLAYNVMVVFI